ncbi:uncharacterized protein [Chelonus insularis]|uniref:uncharacterized protein n=1 Tax=Chelonus insularis TaxID=460826 RepID=UPI0015891774|nr:uncharacterized protein LOC118073253 [Chelonus insularis]
MKINIKYVIFIISLIFYNKVSSASALTIKQILTKADRIISTIERAIFWIGFLGPKDKTPQKTLDTINKVSNQLESIGINLNQRLDDLSLSIPHKIYNMIRMENDIKEMEKNMRDINNMYQLYFVHLKNESISNYTVQSFITTTTSIGDSSLMSKVENIYSLFIPGELGVIKKGGLNIFIDILKVGKQCDDFHASHQWIYELFSLIQRVETRALVMVTTAYKMRSVLMNENHHFDINIVKNRFSQRMNNYLNLEKMILSKVKPTDVYRCDAQLPMKGETYIELEKLTQRFLVNLKKSSLLEQCGSCKNVKGSTSDLLTSAWYKANFSDNNCHGKFIKCRTWSHYNYWSQNIEICEMPANSSRRYQWLRDAENNIYGKKTDNCPGKILDDTPFYTMSSFSDKSETYPNGHEYLCNHCLCTCLEDGSNSSSIRLFNSEAQFSDYKNNMVVIGVQFVKDDENIINIQIKEGKLMPKGKILPGSEKWVPLKKSKNSRSLLKMGLKSNYVNLNDIEIPSFINSSLIIGVKFHRYYRYNQQERAHEKAIGIQIYFSTFDFISGAVSAQYNRLIFYQTPLNNLDLDDVDNPLNSPLNLPDFKKSQWVKFQPTDDNLDAGQTVVPFLDAQPVYTDPGFPLRGIGLFYKGAPGYGGYIAPKILTLDLNKIVDEI